MKIITKAIVTVLSVASIGISGTAFANQAHSNVVRVGVLAPLTGAYAENGKNVVRGAKYAVQQINADGGIKSLGGAKLKLVVADTGSSSPSRAASVTRRVIQHHPHLAAIIGLWASSYTLAGSTVTEQAHIPLLTQSFADKITERGYKYVFQFPAKASKMGKLGVSFLLKVAKRSGHPIRRVDIIADNQSSDQLVGKATAKKFEQHGVKVPVEEFYAPGLTDATSIGTKIMNSHPDLVFADGAISDLSLIMKTLRGMGYKGPFLGSGAGYVDTTFAKATGKAGDGSFATAGWNWDFKYKGADRFNRGFTKKYDVAFAPQEAGEDYAMVYALKAALEKAGSVSHKAVRKALLSINEPSIMTGGRVAFTKQGMDKYTKPVLIEWLHGKPHSIYPKSSGFKPVFSVH